MTTRRVLLASALMLPLAAGCAGGTNKVTTHATTTDAQISIGHLSVNAGGYALTRAAGASRNYQQTQGTSFVRFLVNGAFSYSDITPQQMTQALAGGENGVKGGLTGVKVISRKPVAIPGGSNGYAMILTGTAPNKTKIRQEIVATQSTKNHEVAYFIISSTLDKTNIASRTLSSLKFINPTTTYGQHIAMPATVKKSFTDAMKRSPK